MDCRGERVAAEVTIVRKCEHQRMYASGYGRFNTPDLYKQSAGPQEPGSWNRYAYVGSDPVNLFDPAGLCAQDTATSVNVCSTVNGIDYATFLFFQGQPSASNKPKPNPESGGGLPFNTTGVLSVFDLYNVGMDLSQQVNGKTYTNCQALTDYAGAAAYGNNSAAKFVNDFMNLVPSGWWSPLIPSVTAGQQVVLYQGGDNGFLSQFRNTVDDSANGNGDQAHHFAAFLEWGYEFGSAAGQTASSFLEFAQGLYNGTVNGGDINLGNFAAQIGADLRSGTISITAAVQKISGLCK